MLLKVRSRHLRTQTHLFVKFRFGHLLEVLEVRVEQAAAGERNPQHRLDDVADGAVVGQTDLLGGVHEVTAAEDMRERTVNV